MAERKMYSANLEKRAIRTLCSGSVGAAIVASSITEEHFATESGTAAYKRLRAIQSKKGILLDWKTLVEDPGLGQNIKGALNSFKQKPAVDKDSATSLVEQLNSYRKIRGIKTLAETLYSKVRESDEDPDDILSGASNLLASVSIGANGFNVNKIGKKGNTLKLVKDMLKGQVHRYIPTGFNAFDNINHGIALGSFMMVAATTGGGKSAMLNKLSRNFALHGAKVGIVPLEMDNGQLMARTMADESKVSMTKLLDPMKRLTKKERNQIAKDYIKLEKNIKRAGGSLEMIQPDEDVDIESLLMYVKPKALDVVIIDYIGLLKGADGDDQPRMLSRIGRYCKRWAEINKCVVICAAQLSDEGVVRYSRALAEHCLTGDTLISTPTGLVRIDQMVSNPKEKGCREHVQEIITNGNQVSKTSHWHNNGKKPVTRLTMHNGISIKGTSNHPLLVLKKDFTLQWTTISKIKKGDLIATPTSQNNEDWGTEYQDVSFEWVSKSYVRKPVVLPTVLDEDMGYLIGALLSDGYIGKYGVQFVSKDKAFVDRVHRCVTRLFGKGHFKVFAGTTRAGTPVWRVHTNKCAIRDFFLNMKGMSGGSYHKYPTDAILKSPKSVVLACIRGMFDGDGCFERGGKTINYTSYSPEMLQRLHLLLHKLGVLSLIRGATLNIHGESIETFRKEVGFSLRRKMGKAKPRVASKHGCNIPVLDQALINDPKLNVVDDVPHKSSPATRMRVLFGGRSDRKCQWNALTENNIKTLSEVAPEMAETMLRIIEEGLRFSEVVHKERAGVETVYDLTVPESHNFVANGLYSHNSSNLWQWVYTPAAKETNIISIQQTKARNQVAFDFMIYFNPEFMEMRDLTDKEAKSMRGYNETTEEKRKDKFSKGGGKKKASNSYFSDL